MEKEKKVEMEDVEKEEVAEELQVEKVVEEVKELDGKWEGWREKRSWNGQRRRGQGDGSVGLGGGRKGMKSEATGNPMNNWQIYHYSLLFLY